MGRPKKSKFNYRLFKRGGIYYARFYDPEQGGRILAQRSTGESDKEEAHRAAAALLVNLPLDRIARAAAEGLQDLEDEAEKLRETRLSEYLAWFWSDAGDYVRARADSAPLSAEYLKICRNFMKRYAANYPPFGRTCLRDTSLLLLERFVRDLRAGGVSGNVTNRVLDAIRRPLTWAKARGLLDEPLDLSGIERPKKTKTPRGILTSAEVSALIALPAEGLWIPEGGTAPMIGCRPRPRLKGDAVNEGPAPIDIRMKAVVLLSELAGLRRGEIRGLKWSAVDLERGEIRIVSNFVRYDGTKAPKRDSRGTVPIAAALEPVLLELKAAAQALGRAGAEDYVVFNSERGVPVAESTIARGYSRALEAIGIPDDPGAKAEKREPKSGSRQARRLCLHSGRHHFATLLADEIGERQAARMTRHRSPQAFIEYADHERAEAVRAAREALRKIGAPAPEQG